MRKNELEGLDQYNLKILKKISNRRTFYNTFLLVGSLFKLCSIITFLFMVISFFKDLNEIEWIKMWVKSDFELSTLGLFISGTTFFVLHIIMNHIRNYFARKITELNKELVL